MYSRLVSVSFAEIAAMPAVVVAWHQQGCPACDEYLPTFRAVAQKYAACVPSAIIDANEFSREADGYWVRGTPMTMLLRGGRRSPYVLDGAATAEQLDALYDTVMRGYVLQGVTCELP